MVYTGTSYFGEYARNEIKTEINKRNYKKAFLISDKELVKCGVVKKVEEVLEDNHTPYELDTEVKPNPTIENVLYGLRLYKKSGSDFIIAVGGGSVIDTAKAVAVIANNPQNEDVVSLEGMDKSKYPAVPLVAVPTTAGTGSETTMDYVITNTQEKRKMACMDSMAVPIAAILDTEIMAALPIKLTASTAMDALTHAVESYLSLGSFSFTEMLSLKAVNLIAHNFLKVLKEPQNYEIRKNLAIAQYMAGMSFTNAGLGIVHSMAHPLSAFYDVPHGIANALILPYVLEFNASACPEKMKELVKAFDPIFDTEEKTNEQITKHCVKKIREMNKKAGLPQALSEVGVREEDYKLLAASALTDAATPDNPREVDEAVLIELYKRMYK